MYSGYEIGKNIDCKRYQKKIKEKDIDAILGDENC